MQTGSVAARTPGDDEPSVVASDAMEDDEVAVTMKAWLAADASVRQMVDAFFEGGAVLTQERARDVGRAFDELERLHDEYREACRRRWG